MGMIILSFLFWLFWRLQGLFFSWCSFLCLCVCVCVGGCVCGGGGGGVCGCVWTWWGFRTLRCSSSSSSSHWGCLWRKLSCSWQKQGLWLQSRRAVCLDPIQHRLFSHFAQPLCAFSSFHSSVLPERKLLDAAWCRSVQLASSAECSCLCTLCSSACGWWSAAPQMETYKVKIRHFYAFDSS